MATKQRSRSRRPHGSRGAARAQRYVAPVLDPNWNNPYAPSLAERTPTNERFAPSPSRRRLPQTIAVGSRRPRPLRRRRGGALAAWRSASSWPPSTPGTCAGVGAVRARGRGLGRDDARDLRTRRRRRPAPAPGDGARPSGGHLRRRSRLRLHRGATTATTRRSSPTAQTTRSSSPRP